MERDFTQEEKYIKAKKRVQDIKGFYAHLVVTILVIPFLIFINLRFSSQFHWFWFPLIGWGIGIIFHWLEANNYNIFLGKNWEERKIKEMMEEDNKRKFQ